MWTGRETRGVIKSWDGSETRLAQSVEYACMYPCAVCVCERERPHLEPSPCDKATYAKTL